VTELDPEGRLGLRVDGSHPAVLVDLRLGPGRWEGRVEASGDVRASMSGFEGPARDGGTFRTDSRFEREDQARVTIVVTLQHGDRAHLLRVLFQRISDRLP
jgi:hypothetical protein